MTSFHAKRDANVAGITTTAATRIDTEPMQVADPQRSAIALSYDKNGSGAPRVVAKGYGLIAETIIERARAEGLYVHAAPEMVAMLMHVSLDTEIPPALYQAVAEILSWLYQLESHAGVAPTSARTQPPGLPPNVRNRPAKPPDPPKPVGPRRF